MFLINTSWANGAWRNFFIASLFRQLKSEKYGEECTPNWTKVGCGLLFASQEEENSPLTHSGSNP